MFGTRRRLEAFYYNPVASDLVSVLRRGAVRIDRLDGVAKVFGVGRFKHIYKDTGLAYIDSEDLFKVNPEITKYIPVQQKANAESYFVKRDWLLLACSGQLYGLIGNTAFGGCWHENKIISNHVIRIVPESIDPGYLHVALSHPRLGRPSLTRLAFGTEVPEIAPFDLYDVPVPRLTNEKELQIGELARTARELRDNADEIENNTTEALERELNWINELLPN